MADPGYDFFATGRMAGTPPPPLPPVPGSWPPAPASNQFGSAATASTNQFGTPVAPPGPLAAAGVQGGPWAGPGTVSSWDAPRSYGAAQSNPAHAAPGRGGSVPRNVRAVAVLSMFFGVLMAAVTAIAYSQYLALSDAVASTGAGGASASLARDALSLALVGIVVLATVALLLLVGGGATLANKRWGGWILVTSMGLYVLAELQQLARAGPDLILLLCTAIAVTLFVVLVTGDGRRWLVGA